VKLTALAGVLLAAFAGRGLAEEAEPAPESRPRLRLELYGRLGPALDGKVKLGREGLARAWSLRKDARAASKASWGAGVEVDFEVLDWASVGVSAWELGQFGARRRIHYEGLELDGRAFAGNTRLTTRVQLRFAELSLRYVWRNDDSIRLWFGIGAAWLSTRIALRGDRLRATTRAAEVFAPALTYALEARLGAGFEVYLLSGIALAPQRFPTLTTRLRVGFGYRLLEGLSLRMGLGFQNAFLGEAREQLSKRVRPGHDWRRIRWTSLGLEFGLSFSL
jgi:hypothetical protein